MQEFCGAENDAAALSVVVGIQSAISDFNISHFTTENISRLANYCLVTVQSRLARNELCANALDEQICVDSIGFLCILLKVKTEKDGVRSTLVNALEMIAKDLLAAGDTAHAQNVFSRFQLCALQLLAAFLELHETSSMLIPWVSDSLAKSVACKLVNGQYSGASFLIIATLYIHLEKYSVDLNRQQVKEAISRCLGDYISETIASRSMHQISVMLDYIRLTSNVSQMLATCSNTAPVHTAAENVQIWNDIRDYSARQVNQAEAIQLMASESANTRSQFIEAELRSSALDSKVATLQKQVAENDMTVSRLSKENNELKQKFQKAELLNSELNVKISDMSSQDTALRLAMQAEQSKVLYADIVASTGRRAKKRKDSNRSVESPG